MALLDFSPVSVSEWTFTRGMGLRKGATWDLAASGREKWLSDGTEGASEMTASSEVDPAS